MTGWMIVTSADNFAVTGARGFTVQGVKARHRRKAERMRPGDPLVYYLVREGTFAAVCEIRSTCFEDHTRLWTAPGKPEEDYPWRVRVRSLCVPEAERRVRAESLRERLEFVRKWPPAHWRLAFQGNVHEIPAADVTLIAAALGAPAARAAHRVPARTERKGEDHEQDV